MIPNHSVPWSSMVIGDRVATEHMTQSNNWDTTHLLCRRLKDNGPMRSLLLSRSTDPMARFSVVLSNSPSFDITFSDSVTSARRQALAAEVAKILNYDLEVSGEPDNVHW